MGEATECSSSRVSRRRFANGWQRWLAQASAARPARRRPTIFAYVFMALHESRRRAAERELCRFQHLVDQAGACDRAPATIANA